MREGLLRSAFEMEGEDRCGCSVEDEGGLRNTDMAHACPHVSHISLPKSDGIYWSGNPIQVQEAVTDDR